MAERGEKCEGQKNHASEGENRQKWQNRAEKQIRHMK